jgi:hypothetical protein
MHLPVGCLHSINYKKNHFCSSDLLESITYIRIILLHIKIGLFLFILLSCYRVSGHNTVKSVLRGQL